MLHPKFTTVKCARGERPGSHLEQLDKDMDGRKVNAKEGLFFTIFVLFFDHFDSIFKFSASLTINNKQSFELERKWV